MDVKMLCFFLKNKFYRNIRNVKLNWSGFIFVIVKEKFKADFCSAFFG